MKIRNLTLNLLICLLAAAPVLAGGQDVNETRKVDGDATIVINVLAGTLKITGWDKDEVKVVGILDEKADAFKISGDRDDMEFKVKYPRRVKNIDGSDLEFMVPRGCMLEVETVSTDVDLQDFEGSIELASVSGEIYVDCEAASTEISGVSGDIMIKGVRDMLEVSIVSGSAEIRTDTLNEFSFNAVSGDLDLWADIAKHGDWDIDCHSGNVTLYLPSDVDAEFEVDTFSGDIDNDFGVKSRRTSKYAPGRELIFTNGDGSGNIEISIFSGEVMLKKK
jgi:putative adhesin